MNGYENKIWHICCLQETHLRCRDTYRPKVRGGKTIFHADGNQKKTEAAIFTSDKTDFKIKIVRRDKEGQHIKTNRSKKSKNV